MKIHQFTKTGEYHRMQGQDDQDWLCSIGTDTAQAVLLADGASGCRRAREGAMLACKAAGQILDWQGEEFFRSPPRKIAQLLIEQILYCIEQYKQPEEQLRDYGSTFLMALVEKETGRTTLINLGDGCAFGISGSQEPEMLLRPRTYRGQPCLTITRDACKAVEICEKTIGFGDSIFLCSDGCLDALQEPAAMEALKLRNWKKLDAVLQNTRNADDCSYLALERSRW